MAGLKLPEDEIETALTTYPGNIQRAAFNILMSWLKKQKSGQTAYWDMYDARHQIGIRLSEDEPGSSSKTSTKSQQPGDNLNSVETVADPEICPWASPMTGKTCTAAQWPSFFD